MFSYFFGTVSCKLSPINLYWCCVKFYIIIFHIVDLYQFLKNPLFLIYRFIDYIDIDLLSKCQAQVSDKLDKQKLFKCEI